MKHIPAKLLFSIILAFVAIPAQAVVIYDVTSTTRINCEGAPHGLWTNTDLGSPSCDQNFFDIQDGTTLTIFNDNTALLVGGAQNPHDKMATIYLELSGFTNDHTTINNIKNPGLGNPATWDFFKEISGWIEIDDDKYAIGGSVPGYAFQLGDGANDKTTAFGASSWIQSPPNSINSDGVNPCTGEFICMTSHHWDLNLELTRRPPEGDEQIPAPSSLALLGLGLLWFGVRRKVTA